MLGNVCILTDICKVKLSLFVGEREREREREIKDADYNTSFVI